MKVDEHSKAQRFRDAALPHLDDVYSLARYLLRNAADAEDAAQECYLRAYRYFDTFSGPAIKPWLLTILRNVCRAEYARRGKMTTVELQTEDEASASVPLWQADSEAAENAVLAQLDAETARQLIEEIPEPFRETIILREINDLSYREIAQVVDAPVGTVMSRLARGRALLRKAWIARDNKP
jgi:RNA polymerase sigma-70 factor (ECF subfamily)